MKIMLAILGGLAGSSAIASDFCTKIPFDPELPAGLNGRYEVIGRDPITRAAYSGHLTVTLEKDSYGVARVVNGKTVKGQAWIVMCGFVEKIMYLRVEYDTAPSTLAACLFRMDGDNYYRVTCKIDDGKNSWRGLEAWFQNKD